MAMHDTPGTSTLEIDLAAAAANLRVVRRLLGPRPRVCCVLKADAYGMGAARVAPALADADMFAVYSPLQAEAVLRAVPGVPVLVLMPVRALAPGPALCEALRAGRLHLTVHDEPHLRDVTRLADAAGGPLPVHVEVDTGMSRGGCPPAVARRVVEAIAASPAVRLAGLFTQFADAAGNPGFTEAQRAELQAVAAATAGRHPRGCLVHAAATAATLRDRATHLDMVRVGLAWAGFGPELMPGQALLPGAADLRPVVTWRSRLVQVRAIEPGTPVGYSSRWVARRASRIGLVPVGYADGFPRDLGAIDGRPPRAFVALAGDGDAPALAPIVGAVSMDQMMIDLTDVGRPARVGDPVELVSPSRDAANSLGRLAAAAGTIPHEMLCRLDARVRHAYVGAAAAVAIEPAGVHREAASVMMASRSPA